MRKLKASSVDIRRYTNVKITEQDAVRLNELAVLYAKRELLGADARDMVESGVCEFEEIDVVYQEIKAIKAQIAELWSQVGPEIFSDDAAAVVDCGAHYLINGRN